VSTPDRHPTPPPPPLPTPTPTPPPPPPNHGIAHGRGLTELREHARTPARRPKSTLRHAAASAGTMSSGCAEPPMTLPTADGAIHRPATSSSRPNWPTRRRATDFPWSPRALAEDRHPQPLHLETERQVPRGSTEGKLAFPTWAEATTPTGNHDLHCTSRRRRPAWPVASDPCIALAALYRQSADHAHTGQVLGPSVQAVVPAAMIAALRLCRPERSPQLVTHPCPRRDTSVNR